MQILYQTERKAYTYRACGTRIIIRPLYMFIMDRQKMEYKNYIYEEGKLSIRGVF